MSFGKNAEGLNRVVPYGGNLSQRARHLTKSRENARKSGGGGAPYWLDSFKVPQDHARFGRLIPGQYKQLVSYDNQTVEEVVYEYFMFKEHYSGTTGMGGVCSAGPLFSNRNLREPCGGCDIFWEDVSRNKNIPKNQRQKKRMSTRDMYAFTWWDYGLWYHAPRMDKEGKVVTDNDGKPRLNWVMGRENDQRYAGCEWKYGHLIAWPMGETYKDMLLKTNDFVMMDCAGCGTSGSIQFVSKNCAGCGAVVYDASTTLTPEQRDELEKDPFQCRNCGHSAFLNEVINCQACQNPVRATIFDVDLQVTSVGSKGQQTFLQIVNRSQPRPIQVQDPAVLESIKPLDLAKKFAPTPVDVQQKIWNLPGPPVNPGAAQDQQNAQQPPQMPGGFPPPMQNAGQQGFYPMGTPQPQQPAQQPPPTLQQGFGMGAPTFPQQASQPAPGFQQPAQQQPAQQPQQPALPGFPFPGR